MRNGSLIGRPELSAIEAASNLLKGGEKKKKPLKRSFSDRKEK